MEYTDTKELESAVEGILFASGEPIQTDRICLALSLERTEVEDILRRLRDYYAFERRGMRLLQLEDRWQLCSSPDHAEVIRKAFEIRKPAKLSQPALEALTIIAYYQPTTRAYVDKLRGVDSAYTVGLLLERGLIETCGNLQAPGRPLLYRTTEKFLRSFHISSLDELPPLNEDDAPPQQLRIEDMTQRLTDAPETAEVAETPPASDAAEVADAPQASDVMETSEEPPQVADAAEEIAEEAAETIPAREMMLTGYPRILTAPRCRKRKPAPRKPRRLAETFRTRRKRPGRKRKRRRTARPGREASGAESRHNAPESVDALPEMPEVPETYDELPEAVENYDELPEAVETYDDFPEVVENYDESSETCDEFPAPEARDALPQVRARSGKDRRKRPARKIKRLAGTFRPRKRRKTARKRPAPRARDKRDSVSQAPDDVPQPCEGVSEARDDVPESRDAQAGASGNGAARRGLSAKAARRCLHCMLCGLWLSWPFCSF